MHGGRLDDAFTTMATGEAMDGIINWQMDWQYPAFDGGFFFGGWHLCILQIGKRSCLDVAFKGVFMEHALCLVGDLGSGWEGT